ncbi:hypothetical protein C7M84_004291 [Penaeus vannamei]|uniref:Paired amphipathic helix protein Sin3a n=1 Tax=Penaeus vannamei TaxID=6689 RepID=A0A423TKU1_PENVA|nr:hypothetical protein C7M84_004291 [Penaeus vannamei]
MQVSVSVPGQQTTVVHTPQGIRHHITPTHHPPPPPPQPVTVKPPHHPQPPRSALTSGGVTPHTGPSLVGTHSVHNLRFQGQPDIYKQFLEILHTYQKEQRHIKDGGSIPARTLTETEVYEKVAKLFENQEDLLQEFGQFLPDATNNSAAQAAVSDFMDQYRTHHGSNKNVSNDHTSVKKPNLKSSCGMGSGNNMGQHKATPMATRMPSHPLKPKLGYLKDMSAAEAGKHATLAEYAFFDKVRKALRHEETYHNFLRCITLYNEEIITRAELVQLVHPFLAKFPDLLKWFKDFVGYREGALGSSDIIPSTVAKQERISGDLAMEIDYTTCKRLGASYCALPKSYPSPSVQEEQVSVKKFLMIPGFPSPLGQRIPPLLPHGKLSTKSTFTVVRMRDLSWMLC